MQCLIEPKPLVGEHVTLTPMTLDDAPELLQAASDPETFRYFTHPPATWTVEGMRSYCARLIDDPTILPHTVRTPSGDVIGSTTFCTIRPLHLGLEIGWTWYSPACRGTMVNPQCKCLLLERAFETPVFATPQHSVQSAVRVELKTDARNAASRAAILKLGATFEGVLRQHVLMPDGHRRDTAMYSVLSTEWPAIKQRLMHRMSMASRHGH